MMVDAHEPSGQDFRLELEFLRRDVGCLMREMGQVKTALLKLRGFAAESSGDDEQVYADIWRAKEEESRKAPRVTAHMQELGTAVLPSQFPDYPLGALFQGDADERDAKGEGMMRDRRTPVPCAVGEEGSSFRRGSADPCVDDHPRQSQKEGKTAAADGVVRVADYLSDSVYVWACGEKLDPSDEEVTAPEVVIGWMTILVQAVAYMVLIMGAESTGEDASYSIFSVSLAMFLVLSMSSADIRASHALLSRGGSWGRCLFGAALLVSIVLLVTASLRVLFMVSENNAELVIGAAAVLFIEDVDDKLATCLTSVPKKWRLFWMLQILGASFWIAIVGVFESGNSSAVLNQDLHAGGFRVGYPWLCILGWVMTVWALFLNCAINCKLQAFGAIQQVRAAPVLPVGGETVPCNSTPQNRRKDYQEVLTKGFCIVSSIGFIFVQFASSENLFSWLPYKFLFECIYSAAVFLFFLAGALRATLDSCGACPWRETPDPPQFTWHRLFIGWGLGTFLYLVVVLPFLRNSVDAIFFVTVYFFLMLFVDLLLIAEPTFFGNWGGRCIRSLQAFLMKKNGCVYWAIYFHVVYSAGRWTMSLWARLVNAFHA